MKNADYRHEIDGLRALAVGSVILFHLNEFILPGGFVGVDIFFVISGYLITGIVNSSLNERRFSFKRFYQRRIGRIFPLLWFVVLCTILASWRVYDNQDFASVGAGAAFTMILAANVKMLLLGDYFQIANDTQPLMHVWSLAIEEQFYLIFPIALFFLHRISWTKRRLPLILLLSSILLATLALILPTKYESLAFYLLPTRSWELLAGAFLATIKHPEKVNPFVANLAVLGLLLSVCFCSSSLKHPGLQTLVPVVSTVGFISCVSRNSLAGRLFSTMPLAFVGRISYLLYLWHWPIFSLVDYAYLLESSSFRTLVKVSLLPIFSIATYLLIEKPFRVGITNCRCVRTVFVGYIALSTVTAFVGFWIRNANYIECRVSDLERGGIVVGHRDSEIEIALIGDSHGTMYAREFSAMCTRNHIRGRVLTFNGKDPLPRSGGNQLHDAIIDVLTRNRPSVAIIAVDWTSQSGADVNSVVAGLRAFGSVSHNLVIPSPIPQLPPSFSRDAIRANRRITFQENPEVANLRTEASKCLFANATPTTIVIDAAKYFVSDSEPIRIFDQQGNILYHDHNHLSDEGSKLVIREMEDAVIRLLGAANDLQGIQ